MIFGLRPGYSREAAGDQVMEKIDEEDNVLRFSVLSVSVTMKRLLEVEF